MDPPARRLPRRAIPARLIRVTGAHVRNRDDMGRDVERSGILKLFHRSAQSAPEIQMEHALLPRRHPRHRPPRHGRFRPVRLARARFRRYLAHGDGRRESYAVTRCFESGAYDFFVVRGGGGGNEEGEGEGYWGVLVEWGRIGWILLGVGGI